MKNLIIVFLLFSAAGYGQEYKKMNLLPDSILVKTIVGKRISYAYERYTFEGSSTAVKVRLNKKLILTDESFEGQKSIAPHVFITTDTSDKPIIMVDHYTSGLSGFSLYKLCEPEPVIIGFIPVAAIAPGADISKENTESVGIADKLLLETDGTVIHISFLSEKIIIYPATDNEEIVQSDQIKFLYNGKKLKEVEEF